MNENIQEIIFSSENIFLMGHKNIDLDALGSMLVLYFDIKAKGKDVYLVMDDEHYDKTIIRALQELENKNISIVLYKYDEIKEHITDKSLLLIVDVHLKELVQSIDLYDHINNRIVIDHHHMDKINDKAMYFVDELSSSCCEMILDIVDVKVIPKYIYSIMLAGIMIDTNSFSLKVSDNTYLNAAYLIELGASSKEVQYLLKKEITEYFDMQKMMVNVIIIDDKYAICTGDNKIYNNEFLAKIASSLLNFEGIEMSFMIGKLSDNVVGVSTRSVGNYNASSIMKRLGGGGHMTDAAAQIPNTTIELVKNDIINIIKEV